MPSLEPQPLEECNFLFSRGAAEGGILEEFVESRLFHEQLVGFPFDELESLRMPRHHSGVQQDVQGKRGQVDVPGLDQRIQERDAVFTGEMEDVRIEELED